MLAHPVPQAACISTADSTEAKMLAGASAELLGTDALLTSALIPAVHSDGSTARGLNDDDSLVQDFEYFDKFFLRYNKVRGFQAASHLLFVARYSGGEDRIFFCGIGLLRIYSEYFPWIQWIL